MKPQLIIQDFSGQHGGDLKGTSARLLRGGSWKRQRIVVILPAADMIPAKVSLAHWSLIFPPNNGIARLLALGMEVGDAYSTAFEGVLNQPELSKWEYILTIEHDNAPPQDGVLKLCERMEAHPELHCIGGLYFTKGEGGCAQIWGDIKDPLLNFRPQVPDINGGLVECYGTGMGFNLWRISMFKDGKIPKPWFRTETSNGVCSQDLMFWREAKKYGYRCAVDCSVKVGHYDWQNDHMW